MPLFSKHPAQQNWCFDYENNNILHRMTTQTLRKKILHALHVKWNFLIKYFPSYIKKCQTGTYYFGWVYISSAESQKGAISRSKMFRWEPEGRYCHWLCTAIAPFWLTNVSWEPEGHSYSKNNDSALLVLNGTSMNIDPSGPQSAMYTFCIVQLYSVIKISHLLILWIPAIWSD